MSLTFTTPGLLWALPVALLPFIFHLRARARERVVDFPGAFFMEDPAMPSAQRRRKLEDLLLLVLRSLLFAAVVVALSGPRVKGWGALSASSDDHGFGTEAIVLVVDDSPSVSMRLNENRAKTFPGLARQLAAALDVGPRRRIAVETASGRSVPFASSDALKESLLKVQSSPVFGSGDRCAALARAVASLQDLEEDRRAVILVTDLALNSAEGTGDEMVRRWRTALKRFRSRSADAPAFACLRVGTPPAQQWSVDPPKLVEAPGTAAIREPLAGRAFSVRVRVNCLRGTGRRELVVETAELARPQGSDPDLPKLGRRRTALRKAVVLREGQSTDVVVPALVTQPGAIWFGARLANPDGLPFDDAGERVVSVAPLRSVRVLDCRGDLATEAEDDETLRKLSVALNPLAGADRGRVRDVTVGALGRSGPGPNRLLVGLFTPPEPRISPSQTERLRGALQDGSMLLWIPDLIANGEGRSSSRTGGHFKDLMPYKVEGLEARPQKPDEPGWRLGIVADDDPLMIPFAAGRNGDLTAIRFRRRLRLVNRRPTISTDRSQFRGLQVLTRFDDGLPALVRGRVGDGWVHQMSFGVGDSGGITSSPAWPILLAEFVERAADKRRFLPMTSDVVAGRSITPSWGIHASSRDRALEIHGPCFDRAANRDPQTWSVAVPAGSEFLPVPELPKPGAYALRAENRRDACWFSCRVSTTESSVEMLPLATRKALDAAASSSGGAVVEGIGDLRRTLSALRPGRPVSSWLWSLFGIAMFIELTVLVVRRRSG